MGAGFGLGPGFVGVGHLGPIPAVLEVLLVQVLGQAAQFLVERCPLGVGCVGVEDDQPLEDRLG
jgi:hypothetical protein